LTVETQSALHSCAMQTTGMLVLTRIHCIHPANCSRLLWVVDSDSKDNMTPQILKMKRCRYKEIRFFASRDIAAGEELLFNYGTE